VPKEMGVTAPATSVPISIGTGLPTRNAAVAADVGFMRGIDKRVGWGHDGQAVSKHSNGSPGKKPPAPSVKRRLGHG
jgi:hypothetical protein